MNKFKFYFILLITSITIFSCSKNNNDETVVEPLRDYQTQYNADIKIIETYLTSNYITVTNAHGQTTDQDVIIAKITNAATQPSIMSYLNAPTYPKLLIRNVTVNKVDYKLYYLVLREGKKDAVTGLGGVSPCNVDNVLTSYKGTYLSESTTTPSTITTTQFEEVVLPNDYLSLFGLIRGWKEIFPQFKTGSYNSNTNGTISYTDFGSGIMFIPSGLAYYNETRSAIPAYSPLVFSFKLYDIQRSDNEYTATTTGYVPSPDGVLSYQEDIDGDGYVWTTSELPTDALNPDDTDKDGIPDFLDIDDDGDNYTTKFEIKNPTTGLPYPFANIPTCTSGKKNYLDASCHP
jgi:hypothetical protein